MKPKQSVVIFWFRRDLRLHDNHALFHALNAGYPVLPIFIFDHHILHRLENKKDARVQFIHSTLANIHQQLRLQESSLLVLNGAVEDIFKNLLLEYDVKKVFANHDYEPYAIQRDSNIKMLLGNIPLETYKDQVIFEKHEILSDTGNPYKVYTPYKNKWLKSITPASFQAFPTSARFHNFLKPINFEFPSLEKIGFSKSDIIIPALEIKYDILKEYHIKRDFPGLSATSLLGIHLRFGTISIREVAATAQTLNAVWLSELIWREFFMQLLYHFPFVVNAPFNSKFNHLKWREDQQDFKLWCSGNTGYPLIDAGMRELNSTGHMHNRVRMVTASFLTKHLLLDWRWGEAYFASKLLDFDLSANNGNWQWSAGTGADAQPFFRIFNPYLQQKRFDPEAQYIKKWIPEYGTLAYPAPMVDHKSASQRALLAFKNIQFE